MNAEIQLSYRRSKAPIVLLHILGVSFFVGQDILVMTALGNSITLRGGLSFAVEVATFYANLLWVLPLASQEGRRMAFALRLLVVITGFIIIRSSLSYREAVAGGFFAFMVTSRNLLFTIWRLNYPLAYSFILTFYRQRQSSKQELYLAQINAARADARAARLENTMIQLRLNPHLILGTLEHIYANVEEALPDTAAAVSKLINVTRYSSANMGSADVVPATAELQQVQEHIAIKQLLSGGKLHIHFQESVTINTAEGVMLPPGILLTLTDNVLTHGRLKDAATPAVVTAFLSDNAFCFTTTNHKAIHSKAGSGIGLKSVRSILEDYYPGRHELLVQETTETFTLKLSIQL